MRGIYVGLNVPYFQDPDTTHDHMLSIFVGEEEWTSAADRMQRSNQSVMRSMGEEDRTLNTDRLFSIGQYKMDAANMPRITYYGFYKPGYLNPAALLLPLVLTDTVVDNEGVLAIYARLQINEA